MREQRLKILISPLNWGFGHAGRMIPVATALSSMGHDVVIGADSHLVPMIQQELPGIRVFATTGTRVSYSRWLPQYAAVLLQTPSIAIAALREHRELEKIISEENPDIIISDNRFGFYNKKAFCVYVTHMLRIPFPWPLRFMEWTGIILHRLCIKHFDVCLIPDTEGRVNLSGRLSHGVKTVTPVLYTGILSRFRGVSPDTTVQLPGEPYICLLLSGPEPQRSLLLDRVAAVAATAGRHLVVMTNTQARVSPEYKKIQVEINRPAPVVMSFILNSERVICRSGYTSLMELVSLKKGALIVPTPGQTEQEYLAGRMHGMFGFHYVRQNHLSAETVCSALTPAGSNKVMTEGPEEALKKLLKKYQERNRH